MEITNRNWVSFKTFYIENISTSLLNFHLDGDMEATLTTLVPKGKASAFTPIGRHSSNSLLAFWHWKDKIKPASTPIVWLDTEGFPQSVVSKSIQEFLSILPYGTGSIYDMLSASLYYLEKPNYYPNPQEEFSTEFLKRKLETIRNLQEKEFGQLLFWLEKEVKIKPSDNPTQLIQKSIQLYPKLTDWLSEG
jgi:hypothetical protein